MLSPHRYVANNRLLAVVFIEDLLKRQILTSSNIQSLGLLKRFPCHPKKCVHVHSSIIDLSGRIQPRNFIVKTDITRGK